MRPATAPLTLTDGQREILGGLARSRTAPYREVTRAKALLLAAQGLASTAIAGQLGVSPSSVVAWRAPVAEGGAAELGEGRARGGRKPAIPDRAVGRPRVAARDRATPG